MPSYTKCEPGTARNIKRPKTGGVMTGTAHWTDAPTKLVIANKAIFRFAPPTWAKNTRDATIRVDKATGRRVLPTLNNGRR